MAKTIRARKWHITQENPITYNMTQDVIKSFLNQIKGLKYACMCDEIGLETHLYHTHIYLHYENAREFATIQKLFPHANIVKAEGTAQENRDYIRKEGKYADTDKAETNLKDTFYEIGEIPEEKQGKRTDIDEALEMLSDGNDVLDVVRIYPHLFRSIDQLKSIALQFKFEPYKKKLRKEIYVIFQTGGPNCGKSWNSKYEDENDDFYEASDYQNPFDEYSGETKIIFDEFEGQISLTDMNRYLDEYPVQLRARYFNRWACYIKVYINSNKTLDELYPNATREQKEAFKSRIQEVRTYYGFQQYITKINQNRHTMHNNYTPSDDSELPF